MASFRLNGILVWLILLAAVSAPLHGDAPGARAGEVELTGEERRWLARHPVIRVAPDPDYPPIESIDENGRLVGISADFLKLIENKLGIRFQIIPVASWDEAMSKARTRQVDMLSAATKSSARSRYLSFTTPHIELPGVIIVRTEAGDFSNLDQFRGKKSGWFPAMCGRNGSPVTTPASSCGRCVTCRPVCKWSPSDSLTPWSAIWRRPHTT